ncbi:MAG: hypothetical protein GX847_09570 [Clostridiales bacterium]|nr:hypothetical protein [Clostridiales bacterium]
MAQEQYLNLPYMAGNENAVNMPNLKSVVEETKKHRAMYPDIHYRLEPFISNTCDAIESTGMMPSQEELDDITDDIYDDFCNMYPDMANYMKSDENQSEIPEAVPTQVLFGGGFRPGRRGGFRRRGLGRDLITALLLTRLFGGRRYPYYQPYPYY